jgi:outer membrane lipoprotein SlyB
MIFMNRSNSKLPKDLKLNTRNYRGGAEMNILKILVVVVLGIALAGCPPSRSGKVYSRDQARTVQTVEMGTVLQADPVQIEGTKTPVGTVAGAAVGGVLGHSIGQGHGKNVATVLGAVAGGVAGSAVEEQATKKPGLEITVKQDNGQTLVVVQEADEAFQPGDRVRVLRGSDGTVRVRH